MKCAFPPKRETSPARRRAGLSALSATAATAALLAAALPSSAEVSCHNDICTTFNGKLSPNALPRHRPAPVRLRLEGNVKVPNASSVALPQLKRITLAINRHGALHLAGLPVCRTAKIKDATAAKALKACKGALVGTGHFGARLELPDQPTLIFNGKALVFNARVRGKPGLIAHVFAREPTNLSILVPFVIYRPKHHRGTYGTFLRSPSLPRLLGDEVYATAFSFNLGRRFHVRGRPRSYLNAACPAPKGFPGAIFNFARATYDFRGGKRVNEVLTRTCRVRH